MERHSEQSFNGRCVVLQALPDSLTGSDKSQSFKRILLNTCQEEFEGATEARTVSNPRLQPDLLVLLFCRLAKVVREWQQKASFASYGDTAALVACGWD